MSKFELKSFRDWSQGTWRKIQNSLAPTNSFKLALNFNSDDEMGSLVSRKGTSIIGTQQQASARCYGLHNFRDSVGTADKVFAVYSNGTNNTIHDVLDGTKDLTGDTKEKKTRFLTYLDSVVRVNGTDAVKAFNGTSWITTGGAFDLANWPAVTSLVIEWKDRVYTAGDASNPDTVYYSGVADPSSRAVSWTSGNGTLIPEQEDGGGGITGFAKVPGYLIIFKRRSMKRWDNYSTYPEDLVNQGAPSQESICMAKGMVLWLNENGVWASVGGYPKRISRPIQDFVEAISDYEEVYSYANDTHAYWYIGNVTVDGISYTNVVLKYNIDDSSWDISSYYHPLYFMTEYIDSDEVSQIMLGDSNGNALQLNNGNTDYYNGTADKAIDCSLETQDIDFGQRGMVKLFKKLYVYSENMKQGQVFMRINSHEEDDWKKVGEIKDIIEEFNQFNTKGNFINIKIADSTRNGQVKILGFDFGPGTELLKSSTK